MQSLYRAEPPLTSEQERDLSARAKQGDKAAAEHMIAAVTPLIHSLACRTGVFGAGFDDLVQEATVAAWKAIRNFDPSKGSWPGWVVKHSFHAIGHALADVPLTDPLADAPAPEVDADFVAENEQAGAALRTALRLVLGAEDAELVYVRAVEGLTETQAARRLHRSWKKIRIAYSSGLARLRAVMSPAVA